MTEEEAPSLSGGKFDARRHVPFAGILGEGSPAQDSLAQYHLPRSSLSQDPLTPGVPPSAFSKKYSESRQSRHKNRGIPRMKPLLGRLLRDAGSLSRKNARSQKRPTRGLSRLYALPVGYLGFCAGIFLLECTFPESSAREARGGAEAAPFLSGPLRGSRAVRLGQGSGDSSRPSRKKGGPLRAASAGPALHSAETYLSAETYFRTPSSKARMSTVAARSRDAFSPGARRLPAGSS